MPKRKTKETRLVEDVFRQTFQDCPVDYPPQAYRYNSASIRLRVVNRLFKGKSFMKRFDMIDPIIDSLPEKTQSDLCLVLLLAPEEVDYSAGNYEFEHPTPEPRFNHRKQPARK